jgi:spore coat protein A, manganese oxidase
MTTLTQQPLDPNTIPKYVNQLFIPPVYYPQIITDPKTGAVTHSYTVSAVQFKQQILPPGFPSTTIWGYEGLVKASCFRKFRLHRSSPGATFEAIRGIPIIVKWVNKIKTPHLLPVDPTIHWANPNNMPMNPDKPWSPFPPGFREAQFPVPLVTHLHGGEVPSYSDGHPEAWQTFNGIKGEKFVTDRFLYPNRQQSTTLFYHDHALGITRLNVYAGLAGLYILRDPENLLDNQKTTVLPTGKYEIPLAIQDKSFNKNGSLFFTRVGNNPEIHPYWDPEFFGNTIVVNGRVWPNLNVERRTYRIRIVNASNARFYNLHFSNGQSFTQIGTDGGYLENPVTLTSLLIAPGERADILVDFRDLEPGTSVILLNNAPEPYPFGDLPDENTTGQIMRFSVPRRSSASVEPIKLPNILNRIPNLLEGAIQRIRRHTLIEVMAPNGEPTGLFLNGLKWEAPVTELPRVGTTEIWELINLTGDTHPIHLHLVQFQILNRQDFDSDRYLEDWISANCNPPFDAPPVTNPDPSSYVTGDPTPPEPNERGWKDIVRANPGQVTRIIVRFAPQDANPCEVQPGKNLYPFDPTTGPGYVWHCHILDHEDNEMMRPYIVTP